MLSAIVTVCESPDFRPIARPKRVAADPVLDSVSVGFIMDNVTSLRNYSALHGDSFTIYPDPTFTPFDGAVKRFFAEKNDDLLINVCRIFKHANI